MNDTKLETERKFESTVRLRVCYDLCVSKGLFEKGKGWTVVNGKEVKWFERDDFKNLLNGAEVNALLDEYYAKKDLDKIPDEE